MSKSSISFKTRLFIANKYNYQCGYCGERLLFTDRKSLKENLHITFDHIIPISKKGSNHRDNLILSCRSCNSKKGTKHLEEFREYILNPLKFKQEQIGFLKMDNLPSFQFKSLGYVIGYFCNPYFLRRISTTHIKFH